MSIINVYSNHEAKKQTFFLNDIQGGVHNIVKFQCIISINETLQIKRIVLCPLPPLPSHCQFLLSAVSPIFLIKPPTTYKSWRHKVHKTWELLKVTSKKGLPIKKTGKLHPTRNSTHLLTYHCDARDHHACCSDANAAPLALHRERENTWDLEEEAMGCRRARLRNRTRLTLIRAGGWMNEYLIQRLGFQVLDRGPCAPWNPCVVAANYAVSVWR